ncbi:MAG: chromosome segregation protein SMC [Oscillospiraceae bacterium]
MYLKALEIQGFKSFPDKTVLNFGADITAIVGPNGSGKSNISDAILWVMGEQNSRQLRGTKMEDVIFGGTEKRNQMGFAQVTLVIDNTGHIFPRDESEVAVTRRYYRSGESEYYINRQSVRLKDVNELFMDTGMGREGYSIIGQGKIDEILSVKSGERREVFEEAAGISKFRHRKEESERKLQRTEENLVRINDKIAELELQVEPLRQQAETAKKYLVLRDELRVLEISVWLENLQTLRAGALKLEADLRTAQEDRQRAQADLDAVYAAGEESLEKIRDNDVRAEALRGQVSQLDAAAQEETSAMAVLENSLSHDKQTLERLDRELADTQQRAGNLRTQADALTDRIDQIDAEAQDLARQLEELMDALRQLAESAGSAQQEAEALRAKETLAVADAARGRTELAALDATRTQAQARQAAIAADSAAAREKLDQCRREAEENNASLTAARKEEQAAANVIQGHSLKMEGRRRRAQEAAQQAEQLRRQLAAMEDRIRLLTEMEKDYEGFSRAVKGVMQAADRGTLSGIHGPVASLMTTDPQYTVALEIALGAALQNIVVDRDTDAKEAIAFLKRRDAGRATFLPMSAIRGDMLREPRLAQEYGFVGIASQLVTYDARYDGIFQNLLGRTVVVEDLDCGVNMARRYQNRFRIVTLDGQVINRGGSMTGGSVSRSAGVLSRASELSGLREQLTGLKASLDQAAHRAEETGRDLQKAQYELDVAREQQQNAAQQVLALETRSQHYDSLRETLEATLEALDAENLRLTRQTADGDARRRELQTKIDGQEDLARQLRQQAQNCLAGQSDLQSKTGGISDRITRCKEQQAALAAERQGAESRLADLRQLMTDLDGDCRSREDLARQLHESQVRAREQMAEHQTRCDSLHRQAEDLRGQLQTLQQEKLDLEQQRTALNRQTQTCNDAVIAAQQELSRLEQKRSAAAMEEKTILDKLWERYELSHSEAQAQRVDLESISKATRRIGELNRSIKALGTPNIGAIEEYERVNGRYTYLSDQRADVEQAKGELTGVIDQLTQQMTEIFAQQFRLLNDSFQETFLELFGGGKARLELEDEKDILNCGIEIKVQPPGKQLKTITLLSGGEKAFVAIALYFAILKVHPTPFCVMDEIEAALDEANVVRYARYMRRIAGKDPVHRHHPPAGHHGGGRRALRRHHAGAGRQPDPHHQPQRYGQRAEYKVRRHDYGTVQKIPGRVVCAHVL